MPRNYETNFGNYFKLPNNGLRSYFGNVVKGQPKVYDTPFARGESTEELLQSWKKILKSIDSDWPTLWDFEIDLANKVGPLSVMLPLKDRIADIEAYYEGILLPSKPISDAAVESTINDWSQARGLRMRGLDKTVDKMKKSTNSGSPYFTKRRQVVSDTVPCTTRVSRLTVTQSLVGDSWDACAVLGWRGQEGGYSKEDVKQRVVWMFPFAVNVNELQVYQPLIEAAQKLNIVPAWVGMDEVDNRITAMFDTKAEDDLVVCTDFSKFDQHFNESLQDAAADILHNILMMNSDSSRWLKEVFPVKYMIPLAYDYGKIKFGKHGMGSGSGGTNADETLAHRALQHEVAISAGVTLNPNSQCLGDDGVLTYPGITVKDVVSMYTSHGLEMNLDKQYASTQDCTYLRRWHHKDYRVNGICVGVYSTCRALGRMRYIERFMDPEVWDEEAVELRYLSILENVKYHPLKEQFVDFCMKRDKYRLGIDLPGFLDNVESIAKEKINLMPDFLGYTRTLQAKGDATGGIKNWWIVQYLKSK